MSKLIICLVPQHPKSFRGDAEGVEFGSTDTSGRTFDKKLVIRIPSLSKRELLTMTLLLEPEYERTRWSKRPNLRIRVIQNDTWIEITEKPKNRANFVNILNADNTPVQEHIDYLLTASKNNALSYLRALGTPCVYEQLDELRV